jgi:hypothetical protein
VSEGRHGTYAHAYDQPVRVVSGPDRTAATVRDGPVRLPAPSSTASASPRPSVLAAARLRCAGPGGRDCALTVPRRCCAHGRSQRRPDVVR